MKKMIFLSLAVIAAFALTLQAVVIAPNQSYDMGTWSGVVNTYTSTYTGSDAKYWEYENVGLGPYNNVIADHSRTPSWFTQKYTSATLFNKIDQKYTDGYIQEDIAGSMMYIDISTDNANWTRVWSMAPTAWTTYVPTTWQTFNFASTNTLYVKHGVTFAYAGMWQMIPSWSNDSAGVKLYEAPVPEPATMALLAIGGLALRKKK